MNARDAAVLVFVWVAVQAGLSAMMALQFTVITLVSLDSTLPERVLAIVPTMFLVWAAFRLVRDRVRFAHAVFPDPGTREQAATPRELCVLGVTFIGLYVLVTAAPEFLTWVFESSPLLQGRDSEELGMSGAARFLSAVVDALAGVFLIVNREAIAARIFPVPAPVESDAV